MDNIDIYSASDDPFAPTAAQERSHRDRKGIHIPTKQEVAQAVVVAMGEAWMDCAATYLDDGTLAGETGFAPDFWPGAEAYASGNVVVLQVGTRTFHIVVTIPRGGQ